MDIHVRPADISDIAFVLQGSTQIEQNSYATVPNPMTDARLRSEIFGTHPRAHIVVAEINGVQAGYAMYSFCYFASEGEGIWITSFYIHENFRKTKVGKAVMDYMQVTYPNTSGLYVCVAKTNKIARHFFSSVGAIRYDDYTIYGFPNDRPTT